MILTFGFDGFKYSIIYSECKLKKDLYMGIYNVFVVCRCT